MVVLIGGMDLSGSNYDENSRCMGIVVGTQEKINHIKRCLGLPQSYTEIDKSRAHRSAIASKIEFDSDEIIALCVKIDKIRIINQIKKKIRKRRKYFETKKIWRAYDCQLFAEMREKITLFVTRHGCAIDDVRFQCDADCRNFIKSNGLQHAGEGDAYALSDIIAWANNRGLEPRGTCSVDLMQILEKKLKHKMHI